MQASAPYYPASSAAYAPTYEEPRRKSHTYFSMGDSSMTPEETMGFVRKVYGFMSFQLLITFIIVLLPKFVTGLEPIIGSPAVLIVSMFTMLVSGFGVFCCYQKVPLNYIATLIFTVSMGLFLSSICAYLPRDLVVIAVTITIIVTFGMTIASFLMKERVVWLIVVAIFIELLMIYIGLALCIDSVVGGYNYGNSWLISFYYTLGAMIYAIYIAIDAQMVASGMEPDEYIVGSVIIYIHVIMLFLYILAALASKK